MKKRILALVLASLFVLPLLACTETKEEEIPQGLLLAKDGTSDYRIVIPEDAKGYFAIANELQAYFLKMTGVTLPICTEAEDATEHEFILGNARDNEEKADLEALGEEGFTILQDKESIRIAGNVRGTLYGVYEFFETNLGCRFLGETYSIIPQKKELVISPFEENTQTPGFSWRRHSHTYSNQESMRTNCTWGSGGSYIGGDWTYVKREVCHTFGPLLGWSKSQSYHKQPCLTDEDVYQKMLAGALQWLSEEPDAEIISITQNDAAMQDTGECTCDKCKESNEKYGSSGTLLNFINRMAGEIKKQYPDVMVETLAYIHTEEPPKGGVVPADNVIIRFCTMAGCFLHSLENEDRTQTGIYPANTIRQYERLTEWSKIAENLYIWEYNINFGSVFTTVPNFKRLYENVHLYYELGVDGVFIQGLGESGEFDHVRAYLASKLLWNPAMSYEEYRTLMRDFMLDYYGKGADDILACIDYLTDLLDHTHPSMYHDMSRYWPFVKKEDGTVDRTHCKTMLAYWESAASKASTLGQKRRVERGMIPFLYYQTLLSGMDHANGFAPLSEIVETNEQIYKIIKRESLPYYREGYKIPEKPNLKNTILYWGIGGEGIFNSTTEAAYQKSLNK